MPTLYDADRCPYCARVRIVLAEKRIPHETVVVDLDDRPAWIYEKNALGRVPVLEEGAFCLPESEVIAEYLDERWPEPALLPADPAERAPARLRVKRFDDLLGDDYYALRRGREGARERVEQRLAALDAELEARPFLTGREFGLADIAYVPWVLRLRERMGVPLDAYPALSAWLDRLCERPSVAAEAGARSRAMTVVLLHALPFDERMWAPYDGVAPRLYGRGNTMDAWARSLLAELGDDLVLVGASMGGYCALALAQLEPGRVRGLALVGSRPDADTPERREGRAATIEAIRGRGAAGLWEIMGPKVFPPDADPQVVAPARALALDQHPDELVAAVEAIRDRADLTSVWRGLDVPRLVAVGTADPFVPLDEAQAFTAGAELQVFEGAGHLPSYEREAGFKPVLDAFVERCGREVVSR